MHYDPIKKTLGNVFNQATWTRKLFYNLLDILLLRTWHIHRELRLWKKSASENSQILDAGSGFGQYSFYMSKMSSKFNLLGVDVKDDQVADCNQFFKASGRNNAKFEVGDLTVFKKENTYDLVLCVDVMEHILEDVDVLKNFNASLKPGGMLLISTPSDQGGSDVHEDGETSFIEEHVRDGYGVEDMANKLKMAGFERWEIEYSYGKWGRISWLLSMKYPMLMLNKSYFFFVLLPLYYLLTYPFALIFNQMDVSFKNHKGTGLIVKAWK